MQLNLLFNGMILQAYFKTFTTKNYNMNTSAGNPMSAFGSDINETISFMADNYYNQISFAAPADDDDDDIDEDDEDLPLNDDLEEDADVVPDEILTPDDGELLDDDLGLDEDEDEDDDLI